MKRLTLGLTLLLLLAIAGGGAFLAFWDIPAPSSVVEKTIPNDRFPK